MRFGFIFNAILARPMTTVRRALDAYLSLPLIMIFAGTCLTGCGFQLRGQANLPFDTMHIPGGSPMLVELRRNVAAGTQTKIVEDPKAADAIIGLAAERREKVILAIDTAGRVREFQLRYIVAFYVQDAKGVNWIPTSEIALTRDISFNDAQIVAKEAEEALLYRDMQSDMIQQIMRRLSRARRATE